MEQLARNNLSDQIFDIMSRQIIRNQLKPGETIYETEISKEWGVSRSPVRDALRMREQIRLVERTPKGSYQVADLSIAFIQHFYETVTVLYQYAFAKTAEKATADDIRSLSKVMAILEKSVEKKDFDMYLAGVTQIGQIALRVAANPIVERMALELMPTAERIQWASITFLPDNLQVVVGHIRQGLESIVNRQPEAAAKAFDDFAATHKAISINSIEGRAGGKK